MATPRVIAQIGNIEDIPVIAEAVKVKKVRHPAIDQPVDQVVPSAPPMTSPEPMASERLVACHNHQPRPATATRAKATRMAVPKAHGPETGRR